MRNPDPPKELFCVESNAPPFGGKVGRDVAKTNGARGHSAGAACPRANTESYASFATPPSLSAILR